MAVEPISDSEWKARDDAYTLAEAKRIQADKQRLNNAQEAAKKMLQEKNEELSAMRKVARKPNEQQQNRNYTKQEKPKNMFNVFQKI